MNQGGSLSSSTLEEGKKQKDDDEPRRLYETFDTHVFASGNLSIQALLH